jgi:glycolate oxidase iron-sulfur subunit
MSVCPVYQVSHEETDVARGKMALIEWGQTHPDAHSSDRFNESISRCLLCGACAHYCPNDVATKSCIQKVRHILSKKPKETVMLSSLKAISHQGAYGKLFRKSASFFQKFIGSKLPDTSGMHLRFPLSSITQRHYLPEISTHSFADQYQPKKAPTAQTKNIVYFTGCGANYFFPNTAKALTQLLNINGIDPYVPKEQVCCGLAFMASGDQDSAIALAKKNIDCLDQETPDIILTTCASCGSQIHQWPELLKDDPYYYERAHHMAKCQKDAISFLLENKILWSKINPDNMNARIWYHHPCHLRFGKTQLPVPNQLFNRFQSIEVIYSDDLCCGNGGKFQLSHFDLSMNIFNQRMNDFLENDISHVLTPCTGCQLQFAEGMLRHGLNVKVEHPLSFWI